MRRRRQGSSFLAGLMFSVASLAVLAGGAAAIVHFFPMRHVVTRSATLDAPIDVVFGMLSEVERYPEWRPDVKSVELLPAGDGGIRFREIGERGSVTYRIETSQRPVEFRVRVDDDTLPVGGWRTFALAPTEDGTDVTVLETGEVFNPLFQLVGQYWYTPMITLEELMSSMRGAVRNRTAPTR